MSIPRVLEINAMATKQGFKLAPALVTGPGARSGFGPEGFGGIPGNRPPNALALTPDYSLKTSSRPMMVPPFVIRVTHPSSLVRYPAFPVTD